jgi:predicted nucleotidyltransferase
MSINLRKTCSEFKFLLRALRALRVLNSFFLAFGGSPLRRFVVSWRLGLQPTTSAPGQKFEVKRYLVHRLPMKPAWPLMCKVTKSAGSWKRIGALDPRIFGSVLQGEDTDDSDLDVLIDAAPSFTSFDMARIALEIERLINKRVDVRTPEDLHANFCGRVVAEALPI